MRPGEVGGPGLRGGLRVYCRGFRNFAADMSGRINYLDGLRGFTMLLVVYCHLCMLAYNRGHGHISDINMVLLTFRMPLFFFISGFFLYKPGFTAEVLRQRSRRRLVRQLCPTLIVGALYCIVFKDADFAGMCFDFYKYGYWFTFVSVEMFFIAAPLLYLLDRRGVADRRKRLALFALVGVAASLLLVVQIRMGAMGHKALTLINSYQLLRNLIYFFAGMALRMYYDKLAGIISSVWTLLAGVLCMAGVHWASGLSFEPQAVMSNWPKAFAGIATSVAAFSLLYRTRFGGSRPARMLEAVGKSTLEIYLLHYFVIGILAKLPGYRIAVLKGTAWELPVYLAMSVCVVCACMAAVHLLKKARVYGYLFPDVKPRPSRPAVASGEGLPPAA